MSTKPDHRKKATPPWGSWEVLLNETTYKVKRIVVKPNNRLSYQRHQRRQEHWVVVAGEAVVTLDGKEYELKNGQSIDIAFGVAHRMANRGSQPLVFIEVQTGSYFGEDDIERLEDDYGRQGTKG